MILNFLANAADALSTKRDRLRAEGDKSFQGQIQITIEGKDDEDFQGVVLSVSDNGDGVPEALRQKVFEQFFTTKPSGIGTGIGLALCVEIIRQHGGELQLGTDTELGGALFTCYLPKTGPIKC